MNASLAEGGENPLRLSQDVAEIREGVGEVFVQHQHPPCPFFILIVIVIITIIVKHWHHQTSLQVTEQLKRVANRSTGNSESIAMINKELNTLKVIIIISIIFRITIINTLNEVDYRILCFLGIIIA